jgi:ankyrin repeat protein
LVQTDPGLVQAVDASGWSALSYAAWAAHHRIHEYLLQRGAKGNLFTEAALGPWESFRQRLETNPIGVGSRDTREKATPLIWAVRTGNRAGFELLLFRGADITARDREGNSVVHHAVLMDQPELIEYLQSAGADVQATNARGQTPLHLATVSDRYEICQLLLERGADPDTPDGDGNTPLHLAAAAGNLELCEYLLFVGARPAPENGGGRTPLELAAEQGHVRVVELLRTQMR